MEKQNYIVACFSGGKDSTAMVLRMIELGEHIDEVVCCDTYKEFPAMYRHIDKVKKIIENAGIKFTMLRATRTFDELMFEYEPKRRKTNEVQTKGKGWATARIRWCTGELKKDVVRRYFNELVKSHNIIECVGIAADEEYRMKRVSNQQSNKRHPLIEWGWTEKECLDYCYAKGFDWEGLYKKFKRVSCWCCPLKGLSELRALRTHCPDLWAELHEMDKKSRNSFKQNYSVEDFEKRFAFEEERQAQGLSITNREFHRELKKRLGRD
jgi:3'-phosphoadenosine 5'-phosphosulfate sulfotransferase (PAPS reductase)/FAD synthetase